VRRNAASIAISSAIAYFGVFAHQADILDAVLPAKSARRASTRGPTTGITPLLSSTRVQLSRRPHLILFSVAYPLDTRRAPALMSLLQSRQVCRVMMVVYAEKFSRNP
jgi:hypothetical protein